MFPHNALSKKPLLLLSVFFLLLGTWYTTSWDNLVPSYPESSSQNHTYRLGPDSWFYLVWTKEALKDPWLSFRSPGYPLFLKLFIKGRTEDIQEISDRLNKHPHAETYGGGLAAKLMDAQGLGQTLDRVVYAQAFIALFALALLFFALERSLTFLGSGAPFIACGLLVIAQFFCPLWCPRWILSESLAQPFILLFVGCLLFFHSSKKYFWLYAACFVSAYAFLIRPACAALMLIACVYMAWLLWRNHLKFILKTLAATFFFAPALLYVAQINYTNVGGGYTLGVTQFNLMNGASLSYLTRDDIKDLPTDRAKFALTKFLEKKEIIDQHTFDAFLKSRLAIKSSSDLKKLPETLWFQPVGNERALALWNIALEYYKELGFKTISYRELTALANELYFTAVKNYKTKFLRNRINNFLAGLGIYPLPDTYRNLPPKSVLFLSLAILLLAIIFLSNYRAMLLILASVHLVSLAGIAYSGVMEYRYVYITLFIFRVAVLVGMFGLAHLAWEKLLARKGDKEKAVPPNEASAPEQL